MRPILVLLAATLAGSAALAQSSSAAGDPLQAPECRQALAALHEIEAAAADAAKAQTPRPAASTPGIDPKLAAARKSAARRCLASRADPPVRGRLAQPPLAVPPVAGVRPPPVTTPAVAATPPRAPAPPPLVSITSCDAAGCWTSDGARLNRVGPTLWGSHGACSVVGTVVHCP